MGNIDYLFVGLVMATACFAVAGVLSLLVERRRALATPLIGCFALAFVSLVSVVVLDALGPGRVTVVTESMRELSLLAATHRRLLVLLPLLLSGTSVLILATYRRRIVEGHADAYRNALIVSAGVGLIALFVVVAESVI